MAELNKCLQSFSSKIAKKGPGVSIVFLSGEITVTSYGPCLLFRSDQGLAPLSYPISSLLDMLKTVPTLLLILNITGISIDEDIPQDSHMQSHPECYVMPPLVHSNMASIGAVMQSKMTVSGPRCSAFIKSLRKEILHGVSLAQLHQRVNLTLMQDEDTSTLLSNYPSSLADGSTVSYGKAKAFFISNMNQDWMF
ncbi:hypothetical protein Avbf_05058 [Armadillidium vulgare]|nr:hypothetical protein Avbf_05058 [Armadillidium vulgare]